MEKAYKNLGIFLIVLIPLTFLAFYTTYFRKLARFEEDITTFIHLHFLIASIWILMLIRQPLLIRSGNYKLHRRVGKMSYVLFPLLILSFVPQIIRLIHLDHLRRLFFPLADSTLLVLFYSLAIYHRRNRSKHMRYMIGTALVFLTPTLGRIGHRFFGLGEVVTHNLLYGFIFLILIGLLFLDRRHGKKYQPYIVIFAGWGIHAITFNWLY